MPDNQPPLLPCDLCGGENIQPNIPAWTCGTCGKTYLKGSTLAYMPVSASPVTRSAEVEGAVVWLNDEAALAAKSPFNIERGYLGHAAHLLAHIAQLEASQPKLDSLEQATAPCPTCGKDELDRWVESLPDGQPKPQSDEGLLPHQAMLLIKGSMQAWAGVEMPPERAMDIEEVLAALSQAPVPKPQPYFCSQCGEMNTLPDANFENHKATCGIQPVPTTGAVEVAREVAHDVLLMVQDDSPGEYWIDKCGAVIAPIIQKAMDAPKWECAARKNATPNPVDCNWPHCGCDPHADKVIAALEEEGALATQPPAADGKLREALESYVWLVEWPACANMPARWWNPVDGWMLDAFKALRFSRKEDAQLFIQAQRFMLQIAVATEHGFVSALAQPASEEAK